MTTRIKMTKRAAAGAAGLLLLFAGCVEYRVESTLAPDGGGERYLEIAVEESDREQAGTPLERFRELLALSDERGWDYKEETREEGIVHVFRSRKGVRDAATWSGLAGDVTILGTTEPGPLADVRFQNQLGVHPGTGENGERHLTYQEVFYWQGLIMALFQNQLDAIGPMLEGRFPDMEPGLRGEVNGLLKGACLASLEKGILEMSDRERAYELMNLNQLIAPEVVKTIHRQYPEAEEKFIEDLVWDVLIDRDEADEKFLDEKLPGVSLSGSMLITLRLSVPGRVVSTNAEKREGNVLVWEIDPSGAMPRPVELYATVEVEE